MDDFRCFASLSVRRPVDHEEPAFCLGKKILDATNAKATFNGTSKLFHLRDEVFDLFELGNARARRCLERFNVVFDEEFWPAERPKLLLQIAAGREDSSLWREVRDFRIPVREVMAGKI